MEDAAGLGCEPQRRVREEKGRGVMGGSRRAAAGEGRREAGSGWAAGGKGTGGRWEEAEGQQRGMAAAQCAGQ